MIPLYNYLGNVIPTLYLPSTCNVHRTMFDGEDSMLNGTLMSGVKGFIVSLFVHALT